MNIIKQHLTKNDCYKSATKMNIKGLMIHSVGCNVENPMNFIKSWNKAGVYKCVHAFVSTYAIYETLPYSFRGWHCGKGQKGSYNSGYIGIELTEPKSIRYTKGGLFEDTDPIYTKRYVKQTYCLAVEYFAYLCKLFSLNPLKAYTILSHSEAHKLGYASDHSDVEHLWNYVGLTMNNFRKDVNTKLLALEKNNKILNAN
ncbi:hypothetical protein HMPREF9629_01040 [Peptoanaerobacter stomatis]|uniref:N-acetylmuramoyl-L-alanine amidase domain-containing protein n=1 Tax=Peptoanaerobacter stomatis TaxID=796937 RepID=G9X3T3_9FIRM|nr:peptidoglycan recognition family protein [Peptoanaerobacter stomatis]EHL10048.1 hypothetical protein HMPREF9629_01040 [Peptoanaerobacter stomatis]